MLQPDDFVRLANAGTIYIVESVTGDDVVLIRYSDGRRITAKMSEITKVGK